MTRTLRTSKQKPISSWSLHGICSACSLSYPQTSWLCESQRAPGSRKGWDSPPALQRDTQQEGTEVPWRISIFSVSGVSRTDPKLTLSKAWQGVLPGLTKGVWGTHGWQDLSLVPTAEAWGQQFRGVLNLLVLILVLTYFYYSGLTHKLTKQSSESWSLWAWFTCQLNSVLSGKEAHTASLLSRVCLTGLTEPE